MRPGKLLVKGFTCFRDEATLNFSNLDLFAITGPTGAGKTSLLDAMTYALYGRVPRVGDDTRQLISQGAAQMNIYLEFSIRGEQYRVTRVVHAHRPAVAISLERCAGDRWELLGDRVQKVNNKVTELLGLDYEGFTRTVLLPQGEFDRFLKGSPDERRKILVALLRLELYREVQQRANRQADAAQAEADMLSGQLATEYADATPERLEALRREAEDAAREVAGLTTALERLEQGFALAQEVQRHRREWAQHGSELAQIREALDTARQEHLAVAQAVQQVTEVLDELNKAIEQAAYDPDRHLVVTRAHGQAQRLQEIRSWESKFNVETQERSRRIQESASTLASREREEGEANEALKRARASTKKAREHLAALEARYGKSGRLGSLVEVEQRRQQDTRSALQLEQELRTLNSRQRALAKEQEELTTRETKTKDLYAKSVNGWTRANEAHEEARRALQGVGLLSEQLAEARQRLQNSETEVQKVGARVERATKRVTEAQQIHAGARTTLEQARSAYEHLQQSHAAAALRVRLVKGEACPVCDQVVRTLPPKQPHRPLEEALAAVQAAQAVMDQGDEALRNATGQRWAAEQQATDCHRELATAQLEVGQLEHKMVELIPEGLPAKVAPLASLQRLVQAAEKKVKIAEQGMTSTQKAMEEATQAKSRVEGELGTLPLQFQDLSRMLRDFRDQLRRAEAAVVKVLGEALGSDALTRLEHLHQQVLQAEDGVRSAFERLAQSQDKARTTGEAKGKVAQQLAVERQAEEASQRELARLSQEAKQLSDALALLFPHADGDIATFIDAELEALERTRERRESLLRLRDEKEQERTAGAEKLAGLAGQTKALERQTRDAETRAETARASAERVRESLLALAQEHGWPGLEDEAESAEIDEQDRLETLVREFKGSHTEAVRKEAGLKEQLRDLTTRVARAAECRQRSEAAGQRARVARELGTLLGATQFLAFLQDEALRILAEDGSRYLEVLSGGRYTFLYRDKEFHVLDRWNADEARSVKTLSGGESFLASLALAVALAERMADLGPERTGHEALESLFLDEGFGTLDSETLDTVIQALESLQGHERLVGVVTHIPELADRLPVQIQVLKAISGSRLVIKS